MPETGAPVDHTRQTVDSHWAPPERVRAVPLMLMVDAELPADEADEETEFDRFEALTRKLVAVPKEEVDDSGEEAPEG